MPDSHCLLSSHALRFVQMGYWNGLYRGRHDPVCIGISSPSFFAAIVDVTAPLNPTLLYYCDTNRTYVTLKYSPFASQLEKELADLAAWANEIVAATFQRVSVSGFTSTGRIRRRES